MRSKSTAEGTTGAGRLARAEGEADAPAGEPRHDRRRRLETEDGSAGEHEAVDRLDEAGGIEGIGVARAGRAAAHVDRRDDRPVGEQHGDARQRTRVLRIADREARDVGDEIEGSFDDRGHRGPS